MYKKEKCEEMLRRRSVKRCIRRRVEIIIILPTIKWEV